MNEKLLKRFTDFYKDYLRLIIAVTNTILAVSMIISPEAHDFFFWVTLGFRISTVIAAVLLGNKALWVLYFIFCNVKALDMTYNNFTVVALLSMLFALTPKVTKRQAFFVAGLYLTDVFVVAGLHNKSGFYIYTHILLSAQYVTAMWKQKVSNKKGNVKMMVFTTDEISILDQLKNGEPIKQVEGFSEATVYRKLTDARERNHLASNEELINAYKVVD